MRRAASAAFVLALALGPAPSRLFPQGTQVDKSHALQAVRQLMLTTRGNGDWTQYFSIGDIDAFLASVDEWLNGIAVDTAYLRQVESGEGYTQPSGWNGFARALGNEEWKYAGYIVLRGWDPARDPSHVVTLFHETIHAFALAKGAGGVDEDEYSGPEYLSGPFVRFIIPRLRTQDEAFTALLRQVKDCQQEEAAVSGWLTQLQRLDQWRYENQFGHRNIGALLTLMGGKMDWAGYQRHMQRRLALARADRDCAKDAAPIDSDEFADRLRGTRLALDSLDLMSRDAVEKVDRLNAEHLENQSTRDEILARLYAVAEQAPSFPVDGITRARQSVRSAMADARGARQALQDVMADARAAAPGICAADATAAGIGGERFTGLTTLMGAAHSQSTDAETVLRARMADLERTAGEAARNADRLASLLAELREAARDLGILENQTRTRARQFAEERAELERRLLIAERLAGRVDLRLQDLDDMVSRSKDGLAGEALTALRSRFVTSQRTRPRPGAVPARGPVEEGKAAQWEAVAGGGEAERGRLISEAAEARALLGEAGVLLSELAPLRATADGAVREVAACVKDVPAEDRPDSVARPKAGDDRAPSGSGMDKTPPDAAGSEMVSVPQVTNLPLEEAVALIRGARLAASVESAGETEDPARADRVLSQSPLPNERAPEGSGVVLRVLLPASPAAVVPDVLGVPIDWAVNFVEGAGLVPVIQVGADAASPEKEGTVSWQGPAAGSDVPKGSEVTLEVYVATVPGVMVPDLVGKTIDAAQGMVVPNGADSEDRLFLDPVTEGDAPSKDQEGVIRRQYPEPGLEIPRGTAVRVWHYGKMVEPDPDPPPPPARNRVGGGMPPSRPVGRAPSSIRFPVQIEGIRRQHTIEPRTSRALGPINPSTGVVARPATDWVVPNQPNQHRAAVAYNFNTSFADGVFTLEPIYLYVYWYSGPGADCTQPPSRTYDRVVTRDKDGNPVWGAFYEVSLASQGKAAYAFAVIRPGRVGELRSQISEDVGMSTLRALLDQVAPYAVSCQ